MLETLLDKIATPQRKKTGTEAKIKKALFYPTAVIVVAILITSIIMIFVIPQFKDLFSSFGADPPAFTRMVITPYRTSSPDGGGAILGAVVGAVVFASNVWKRSPKFRETMDRLLLKVPVIGSIIQGGAGAFHRTTATMFAAGVPLVEALQSVAGATGSAVYGKAVLVMRDDVATGQSLQLAMRQQGLFPHMVIQMVTIGENRVRWTTCWPRSPISMKRRSTTRWTR